MASSSTDSDPLAAFKSLRNKTILITGAARGLGLTFAQGLAAVGANIAAVDLGKPPANVYEELESRFGVRCRYYQADVTDYDALGDVVRRVGEDCEGSLWGCIPAAGIIRDKPFLEHTKADFEDTMAVNLNGVLFTVQHCAAQMVRQKTGGSIVCIASTAGHKSLRPQTITAYTAAKFAVRGLTKQVAAELAQYGIRVNSISPGTMMTDMLQSVMDANPTRRKLFEDSCAMGRLAKPDELNGMMLYLLSDASSYTTGADFLVDGGCVL